MPMLVVGYWSLVSVASIVAGAYLIGLGLPGGFYDRRTRFALIAWGGIALGLGAFSAYAAWSALALIWPV